MLPKFRSPAAPGLSVALVVELVAGPDLVVLIVQVVWLVSRWAGFGAAVVSALKVERFWKLLSWILGFDLIRPSSVRPEWVL